jgi:hypothetical protein
MLATSVFAKAKGVTVMSEEPKPEPIIMDWGKILQGIYLQTLPVSTEIKSDDGLVTFKVTKTEPFTITVTTQDGHTDTWVYKGN